MGRSLYAYTLKRLYVNKPVTRADVPSWQAENQDEILTPVCLAIMCAKLHNSQCVFNPNVKDCDRLGAEPPKYNV